MTKSCTSYYRMAIYIELEDKTDYTGSCFWWTGCNACESEKRGIAIYEYSVWPEDDYFYENMQMRARQCAILKEYMASSDYTTPEREKHWQIFIRQTGDEFASKNNGNLPSELERSTTIMNVILFMRRGKKTGPCCIISWRHESRNWHHRYSLSKARGCIINAKPN